METELLLKSYLKRLKLSTVAQNYLKVAQEAAQGNLRYEQYLLALLEQEVAAREANRQRACIIQARFPVAKTLDTFDFGAVPSLHKAKVLELSRGDYLANKEVVFMVGSPGTGKTHIATALGICACRQGKRVRFYTVAGLVNDLTEAQVENRLGKLQTALLKPDLIILDELGFVPFSKVGAELLFTFCAARYERGAMIITTNLEFASWTEVFGDPRLTAALLDRLTHRSHILEFNAESYRFRESLRRREALP